MADWPTIASLATATGTLVLAAATFASVRSANRTARAAERSLLAGLRPLLVPGRLDDPPQKVIWQDRHHERVDGGRAVVSDVDGAIYMAASVRNAGSGIAVLHGWYLYPEWRAGSDDHELPEDFRRLTRDIHIPAGDQGFWQGTIRDADDPWRAGMQAAVAARDPLTVDILYGDHEGGQHTIVRLALTPIEQGYLCGSSRYWNIDRPDPR